MGEWLCLSEPQFSDLPSGPNKLRQMTSVWILSKLEVSPSTVSRARVCTHTHSHTHTALGCRAGTSESLRATGSREERPHHPPPQSLAFRQASPARRGQNLRDPPALGAAEACEGGAPAHDPHSPRVPGGQEPHPHRHGGHLQGKGWTVSLTVAPGEC